MYPKQKLFIVTLFLYALTISAFATSDNNQSVRESPWLLVPLVSSSPKLGTSAGAMAGYIHKFDEVSPPSMFGLNATYSTTNSLVAALFAKMYFDEDRQRLMAAGIYGTINNNYVFSNGTVNTNDDMRAFFTRYQYRLISDWFIGAQIIMTNYTITGLDDFSNGFLEDLQLDGFKSNGLGLVVERDTRDNQNSPTDGSTLLLHSITYRETFGGEVDFDVYTLKSRKYFEHFTDYVLAVRLDGRWSVDAPPGAYSTVDLRGYTPGQYLAKHMTTLEIEERIPLTKKWGAELFTGLASLYGSRPSSSDNFNWYPSVGAGVNYMLKEESKMIIRADVAAGEAGNYGIYLQFGRAF